MALIGGLMSTAERGIPVSGGTPPGPAPQNLLLSAQGQSVPPVEGSPPVPNAANTTGLAWDAYFETVDFFNIYRSTDNISFSVIDTSAVPSYRDINATLAVNGTKGTNPLVYPANTYYYKVSAVVSGVESALSTLPSYILYNNGTFFGGGNFDNALTSNFTDTSGNPPTGTMDIKNTLTGQFGEFIPYMGGNLTWFNFWTGAMQYLQFDLKLNTAGLNFLLYALITGDQNIYNVAGVSYHVNIQDYGPVPSTGAWGHYKIPLASFLTDSGNPSTGTYPAVLQSAHYKWALHESTGSSSTGSYFMANIMYTPT